MTFECICGVTGIAAGMGSFIKGCFCYKLVC